jgi:MscS family membrane protein
LLVASVLALVAADAHAQTDKAAAPVPQTPAADAPADSLGRSTPRGTVLGFLNAGRKGEYEIARQYLDTRLSGTAAEVLADQLFVVLDARLPARLAELSDNPEGSRTNPLTPDRELVGTISSGSGTVEVFVDRVQRRNAPPVWLFAGTTLELVPTLYEEVMASRRDALLPSSLVRTRIWGVRVVEWLAVLLSLPILYLATVLLNRILTPLAWLLWRRATGRAVPAGRNALPVPARLLILAIAGRWLLSALPLSLLMRQFWNNIASLLTIVAVIWLLILLNGEVEEYLQRRVPRANVGAAKSLLRVVRRTVDLLFLFAGLIATLRYFRVDPTPALAGLGVGGIAVALAAQKTLENVIAGASLIFDQAVRVGDVLKMGDTLGTVDHIGLRSTRIRTLDRTVVSVPNGQIANASLETLSARDKYWFHPVVGLRYETTPEQLRAVVDGIRRLLEEHPAVDPESVRVRFFRLGSFSLDIEVFSYLFAADWNRFLEMQEQLLFSVTEIVRKAGTEIAFPSQTMYVSGSQPSLAPAGSMALGSRSVAGGASVQKAGDGFGTQR